MKARLPVGWTQELVEVMAISAAGARLECVATLPVGSEIDCVLVDTSTEDAEEPSELAVRGTVGSFHCAPEPGAMGELTLTWHELHAAAIEWISRRSDDEDESIESNVVRLPPARELTVEEATTELARLRTELSATRAKLTEKEHELRKAQHAFSPGEDADQRDAVVEHLRRLLFEIELERNEIRRRLQDSEARLEEEHRARESLKAELEEKTGEIPVLRRQAGHAKDLEEKLNRLLRERAAASRITGRKGPAPEQDLTAELDILAIAPDDRQKKLSAEARAGAEFVSRLQEGAKILLTDRFHRLEPVGRSDIQVTDWLTQADELVEIQNRASGRMRDEELLRVLRGFHARGLIRLSS